MAIYATPVSTRSTKLDKSVLKLGIEITPELQKIIDQARSEKRPVYVNTDYGYLLALYVGPQEKFEDVELLALTGIKTFAIKKQQR